MRLLFATCGLIVFCTTIALGAAYLPNTNVQVFTPNGRLTTAITAKSTTVDLSTRTAYRIRSSVDCKYRALPTSAKEAYVPVPIFADVPEVNGVNIATPFLNHSGCVGTREEM